MSNFIAGVMYGHLIQKYSPGMLFDESDYLYDPSSGSCSRENLDTEV